MGAVTGKGLSDLIREEFGFRVTFLLMTVLVVTNFGNVMAEFAGVASSLELFGIPRFIVLPIAAALVWVLVVHGTYNSVEKIFLVVVDASSSATSSPESWRIPTGKPPRLRPSPGRRMSASATTGYLYIYTLIGLVGTTIAPWMQFYLQASVVEKGITARQFRAVAVGRDRRLPLRRRHRLVHHRRLRGDAAHRRPYRNPRRGRRGPGAPPAGRRVRVHPLCGGALQRVALRGDGPADLDVVHGLRRARIRIGTGQEIPRSAGVLLAVYAADRGRGRRAADPARSRWFRSWCCRRSSTAWCCRSS